MPSLTIIGETPVIMVEVKENIAKIKARDKALRFRSARTEEFLNQFVHLSLHDAQELREKLEKFEIPRVKPDHIVKIVDLLPLSAEEVKSVLSGYALTISSENCKKIADLVKEYQPKQKHTTATEAAEPPATE